MYILLQIFQLLYLLVNHPCNRRRSPLFSHRNLALNLQENRHPNRHLSLRVNHQLTRLVRQLSRHFSLLVNHQLNRLISLRANHHLNRQISRRGDLLGNHQGYHQGNRLCNLVVSPPLFRAVLLLNHRCNHQGDHRGNHLPNLRG